jgi:spermidine/putrescine transport system permease protein
VTRLLRHGYLGLVCLALYAPLGVLGLFSFNDSRHSLVWKGFTWRWYERLLTNDQLLQAALNSLTIATLAATCATLIGTLAAVALYRYRFSGSALLHGTLFVVMVSPDIVMGISLLILFVAAGLPLGFWTLFLAHVTFCIPFVTMTVLARLSGFDKHVIEAGMDLGASEQAVFRHIIVPMMLPAVFGGWLLSFTISLDDVIISFFTTGPTYETLPLRIYSMVRLGVKPEVNALSMVILGVTVVLVFLTQLVLKERKS